MVNDQPAWWRPLLARAGERLERASRGKRWWLGLGAALLLVSLVGAALPSRSLAPVTPALVLWTTVTGLALARALWRRLTYRIGVRLFFSYLVIGVTPFALAGALALVTGYMLTGQYASTRLRSTMVDEYDGFVQLVSAASDSNFAQGLEVLREGCRRAAQRGLTLEWVLQDGARVETSSGQLAAQLPPWVGEEPWAGPAIWDGRPVAAAGVRRGGRGAAVFVPLDIAAARVLPRDDWYEVRFVISGSGENASLNITVGSDTHEGLRGRSVDGRPATPQGVDERWLDVEIGLSGLWSERWVVWFAASPEAREWAGEATQGGRRVVALLKVSPRGAFRDLFGAGPYQLADKVVTALGVIGAALLALYALAVSLAAWMIVAIARSTARLTRGARAVATGDLGYRIPVKRRDQLGELAVAFNNMTDAVTRMLADVREKERLTQELALAREIQRSLLPDTSLRHGALAMAAHFRPAAEIGGDFFDAIRLGNEALLVAVGDVAGHGLHTGLHMAMVKATLAALAREGHRGADLMRRLNELIRMESSARPMVTLVTAEIDAAAQKVCLTSAGHPPAFLLHDGEAREISLPALPLGFASSGAPASITFAFAPGDRLVLYSDGLVEARRGDGEPFDYPRLAVTLANSATRDAEDVIAACLEALDGHLAGTPVSDDVTLVVVQRVLPLSTAP